MQPHEQRVVDEHKDLDEKLDKLIDFVAGEFFAGLPEVDRILLLTQKDQMFCYLNTLHSRIERFK